MGINAELCGRYRRFNHDRKVSRQIQEVQDAPNSACDCHFVLNLYYVPSSSFQRPKHGRGNLGNLSWCSNIFRVSHQLLVRGRSELPHQ